MDCLTPQELLMAARGENTQAASLHIAGCRVCREKVAELRELAAALQSASSFSPTPDCVDDSAIAGLADGSLSNPVARAHITGCGHCQMRVAAVAKLLEDPDIHREISALAPARRAIPLRWSRVPLRFAGGLAAAAVAAIVLLGPVRSRLQTQGDGARTAMTREPLSTVTPAPRPEPTDAINPNDSLRWTAVPQADLYRIRVWTTDGTVVWTTDTRDTTVALPSSIHAGIQYLWEVKARTGWDRWVASDLVPLTINNR